MFTKTFFETTETPLLIIFGDSDQLVPFRENGKRGYRSANAPRAMVQLREGSHTGFAGPATAFDPNTHYDAYGCTFLAAGLGETDPNNFAWKSFAGEDVGVRVDPKYCPLPCVEPIPATPAMEATRHHALTKVSGLAFFDAYLKEDPSARCFLAKQLRSENADVKVRARGLGSEAPVLGP